MKTNLLHSSDYERAPSGRLAWTPENLRRALDPRARLPVHLTMFRNQPAVSILRDRPRPLSETRTQRDVAKLLVHVGFEEPTARRPLDIVLGVQA